MTLTLSPNITLPQASAAGLVLARHGVATLRPQGEPMEIRLWTGRLWITQSGESEDVVLHPGEVYRSKASGLIVVEALDASTFGVPQAG